jgi:ERCC4-type nuclease
VKLAITGITSQPLKSVKIPEGFVLLQDTREQQPLFDEPMDGLTILPQALDFGDYSVKGFEDRICFERKRISDFYSYIGKERDRTTKKMEEFKEMVSRGGYVGLVIEADEDDILMGYVMSRVPPAVARQALVSFEIRSGVHVYYSRSRESIRRWILDRAVKWYKIQREVTDNGTERVQEERHGSEAECL